MEYLKVRLSTLNPICRSDCTDSKKHQRRCMSMAFSCVWITNKPYEAHFYKTQRCLGKGEHSGQYTYSQAECKMRSRGLSSPWFLLTVHHGHAKGREEYRPAHGLCAWQINNDINQWLFISTRRSIVVVVRVRVVHAARSAQDDDAD